MTDETPSTRGAGAMTGGTMREPLLLLLFFLGGQGFAIPAASVEKVVRVVEITPLPGAPETLLGIVNRAGTIVPVFDLRRCLGMPPRDILLTDHLVFARTSRRAVAFMVDAVNRVVEAEGYTTAAEMDEHLGPAEGVVTLPEGLVIIHVLDRLLAGMDDAALEGALEAAQP